MKVRDVGFLCLNVSAAIVCLVACLWIPMPEDLPAVAGVATRSIFAGLFAFFLILASAIVRDWFR